jgi:putative endonuclease
MDRAADEVVAWVYLLRCLADDSLYTGWTVDLSRRLAAHQAGTASRYTRSRLPVELAVALPMPDARAARREEARIKRLRRPAKLALIDRGRCDAISRGRIGVAEAISNVRIAAT